MVALRCRQLDIPLDSDHTTMVLRAFNVRSRLPPNPKPDSGAIFANAVFAIRLQLTVAEVSGWSVQRLAMRLREEVKRYTPDRITSLMHYMRKQQKDNNKV